MYNSMSFHKLNEYIVITQVKRMREKKNNETERIKEKRKRKEKRNMEKEKRRKQKKEKRREGGETPTYACLPVSQPPHPSGPWTSAKVPNGYSA